MKRRQHCAYCRVALIGEPEYSIHLDGFDEGPEVPLCGSCGGDPDLSCEQIWRRISRFPAQHEESRAP